MADETLQEAFQWASGVVHGVKPHQLDGPTRCDGWTVHMLLNHMIGAARQFAEGIPGGSVNPQVDPAADITEGDAGATYDRFWPGVVAAWEKADPEGSTDFPWGPTPNFIGRQLLLMESAVHGSDLAAATGQDATIPDNLTAAVSELAGMLLTDPANRGDDFAPPVVLPDDASASDKLIAFLGRHP